MRLLDRYIGRTVIGHTLVALFIMLILYFFSTLVNEMGYVGKGNYSAANAVLYSIMLLPRQAYELFPMVALLGAILGLGALAGNSELTVIRAAGVSIKRIALAVSKAGLLMIVLIVVLGEGVAPELEKEANQQRLRALSRSISLNTSNGLWAKDGESFINIRRLHPDGKANDISLYHLQGQRISEIDTAAAGVYKDGVWLLGNVRKTLFSGKSVSVVQQTQMQWNSSLTPEVINLAAIAPENLAAWELYEYVGYLQENGLASQRYEVALWIRLMMPLATGGMILLALPFVFGSTRSAGVGQRIMIGALIGIAFYLANGVFSHMGLIYDLPPFISASVPTILIYSVWFWLMRRVV
jgi:lipopolysaccharide export system permease protein